jgi:hypothetical protein
MIRISACKMKINPKSYSYSYSSGTKFDSTKVIIESEGGITWMASQI